MPTPSVSATSSGAWLYVLTGYEKTGLLDEIVRTPTEGLVVDAFKQTPDAWFTLDEVASFKRNRGTVLAYVSIGEAEDYRYYWNSEWSAVPPSWMGRVNPQWQGNVKVKYWDSGWQALVFDYVRNVARQGFDGAYLDIVDAYEYWSDSDDGEAAFSDASFEGMRNYLERDEAARRMIGFIGAIRDEGRKINPDFKIFPQNAQQLVDYPGYLDTIDGIGREDTWYVGFDDRNEAGSRAEHSDEERLEYELEPLRRIKVAGKTVLVVDYFDARQRQEADDFRKKAEAEGFFAYPADTRKLVDVSSLMLRP